MLIRQMSKSDEELESVSHCLDEKSAHNNYKIVGELDKYAQID